MGAEFPYWPEDYLDFVVTNQRSVGVRPSLIASLAAPLRVEANWPRIADMWVGTKIV
jgi:hypothetical protein